MDKERVISEIVDSAMTVHTKTGPGLWEKLYEFAMMCELEERGLRVERQKIFDFRYLDRKLCGAIRVDMVVEGCVLLELKSIERISQLHLQQCSTYLATTGLPAGILLNFNVTSMKNGVKRCFPPRRVDGQTYYSGKVPVSWRERVEDEHE